MSLNKSISLTVNDYDIKLSSNIKFYQNDQLKLKFEINEYGINVENGVKVRASMPITPLSAILFIETPLGVDSVESAVIENNTVTFYLSSTHTQHVGISRMQIQLSDEDGCQVTLPPFQFEIRENIYDREVILNQVLLADEDNNILVDENGNGLNIGTQVSSQTYAVALSADETKTETSSIPTKQIQDYDLKIGVKGTEDLLIQDNGITKRMKTSELMDAVTIDISIYYTKEEINTLLENKADASHTHVVADIADLSIPIIDVDKAYVDTQLKTKANVTDIPDLTGYVLKTEIPTVPTKVSELTNDSGYITTIPTEYITETELNTALSTKANTSDIPSLEGYATETYVKNKIAEASLSGGEVDLSSYATKDELTVGLAKKSNVEHIHSYNDLTNKPTIPSVEGLASTEYVDNAVSNITIDTSNLATKDELNAKANSVHTHISSDITGLSIVATSGDYNDLLKKPVIPTVDVNKEYVDAQLSTKANISDIPDLTGYALKTEIPSVPTNTSELVNDSGFLTSVPNEYITETELSAKGYLVSSDIVGKANISDLSSVATTGDYNDLLNKPNVTNGKDGENGATFTPNVDTDGNLSWTNDKELENPTTINIKGAKGDKGEQGEKGADGKDGQDGLTTSISLNGTVYSHVDGTITLPDYPTIPTKTSDLINDSEFLTSIPTEYITEAKLNEKGYLTEHQDISGKANISDLSAVATSGNYNDLINKPTIPSIDGLATETYVNNKIIPNLVGNTVTNKTLTLTVDKYQYAVLSNGDSIELPSVSSFTEIHLFFKASADLTLTFPSVRWQSIPSITSGHTYEIIFTYVVDEWLAGVICYE